MILRAILLCLCTLGTVSAQSPDAKVFAVSPSDYQAAVQHASREVDGAALDALQSPHSGIATVKDTDGRFIAALIHALKITTPAKSENSRRAGAILVHISQVSLQLAPILDPDQPAQLTKIESEADANRVLTAVKQLP